MKKKNILLLFLAIILFVGLFFVSYFLYQAQNDLDYLQNKHKVVVKENEELSLSYNLIQQDNNDLRDKLIVLKDEANKMSTLLEQSSQEIKKLEGEISSLKKERDSYKLKLNQLEKKQ